MFNNKGFTLIEILVVLLIISALAAIAIPSYINMTLQGEAKTAENNLVSIYGAERNFYINNASIPSGGSGTIPYYCATSNQFPHCADSETNIDTNLSLNITDTYFTYVCTDPVGDAGAGLSCTAATASGTAITFVLSNSPIVLPGGTSCPGAGCNPTCTPSNLCPSN